VIQLFPGICSPDLFFHFAAIALQMFYLEINIYLIYLHQQTRELWDVHSLLNILNTTWRLIFSSILKVLNLCFVSFEHEDAEIGCAA
jgi:hypothetical protein